MFLLLTVGSNTHTQLQYTSQLIPSLVTAFKALHFDRCVFQALQRGVKQIKKGKVVRPAPTAYTEHKGLFPGWLWCCPACMGQKAKGKGLFGLIPRLKAALLHPVRHNKPLFAPSVVLTAAASFHLEMSTCTSFATLFCFFNRTSFSIIEHL